MQQLLHLVVLEGPFLKFPESTLGKYVIMEGKERDEYRLIITTQFKLSSDRRVAVIGSTITYANDGRNNC